MAMTEFIGIALSLAAGGVFGGVFFGGLWWTTARALNSRTPAIWLVLSFPVRAGVALTGFYAVAGGDWRRVLACGIGFLATRGVITRLA
jgi:F1F0 ATPase subunit 2